MWPCVIRRYVDDAARHSCHDHDENVAASPEVVVHVGCDAARFARDLALFTERGYAVTRMRAFDAFPLTHHVEAIAVLVPIAAAGV